MRWTGGISWVVDGTRRGARLSDDAAEQFIARLELRGVRHAPWLTPHRFLQRLKESDRRLIEQHVAPDEWVFESWRGWPGQTMVMLADRLLIAKRRTRLTHDLPADIVNEFRYDEITAVERHSLRTSAIIEVRTASSAVPLGWTARPPGQPPVDVLPNCLTVVGARNIGQSQALVARLRETIANGGFRPPTAYEIEHPNDYNPRGQ